MDFSNHPIANRVNESKPIANRNNSQLVDVMLEQYSGLIAPQYLKWFAKRFYMMKPELVARCASEANVDGKDARRLFSFLIKKHSLSNVKN